jgi:hypothetical protein
LKENIETKIQHIFKRINVLLKSKRIPDLHRGISTDTTISVDSIMSNDEESSNNNEERSNNNEERSTNNEVNINNIEIMEDFRDETVDTVSIDIDNEIQYKSDEDDEFDPIENILNEDSSGLRKLYYVIFKDGGYGWLDENQISDILLSNWNNKK